MVTGDPLYVDAASDAEDFRQRAETVLSPTESVHQQQTPRQVPVIHVSWKNTHTHVRTWHHIDALHSVKSALCLVCTGISNVVQLHIPPSLTLVGKQAVELLVKVACGEGDETLAPSVTHIHKHVVEYRLRVHTQQLCYREHTLHTHTCTHTG